MTPPEGSSTVLLATEVGKTYGRFSSSRKIALESVNLHIAAGERVVVIGPNGAGKSTLLRLFAGVENVSSGRILVFGAPPIGAHARERITYLSDASELFDFLTARETLAAAARLRGLIGAPANTRVEDSLRRFGLADAAKRRVGGFSLGMRRRLSLAAALIAPTELTILDEPTSGLDADGLRVFRGILEEYRDARRTMIIASHDMTQLASVADRLILMRSGRVSSDESFASACRRFGTIDVTIEGLGPRDLENLTANADAAGLKIVNPRPSPNRLDEIWNKSEGAS